VTPVDPYMPPEEWSENEDAYLTEYYGPHTAAQIAHFLDRRTSDVMRRSFKLGLEQRRNVPAPTIRKYYA